MADQGKASQEEIDALIQHYESVLCKLKEIESKEENEEEDESEASELDEYRRSICGCVHVPEVEKPAETKDQSEEQTNTEETESENNESQQKKAELYKKTEKSQKLHDDLNIQPFSPVLAEKLSKVIAEICKEGKLRCTGTPS